MRYSSIHPPSRRPICRRRRKIPSSRAVVAVFDDRINAEYAVDALEQVGFTHDHIGYVIAAPMTRRRNVRAAPTAPKTCAAPRRELSPAESLAAFSGNCRGNTHSADRAGHRGGAACQFLWRNHRRHGDRRNYRPPCKGSASANTRGLFTRDKLTQVRRSSPSKPAPALPRPRTIATCHGGLTRSQRKQSPIPTTGLFHAP